ncbi:hypothetical protein NDI56_12790 [Haloarcula sp. S1CR25-12]|uniref:DUF2092 domain-containing protein n=1 Tax=Haloarcula saliterrae TaxID=2950534 RepID=A0ABU2FDD5_9EURY|nr:hypothetical protein [Haloarcula sp. S1CR25-12]MDS0260273.1 hypothetical protein [Haloarcula sp. S1CR25-12]
MVRSALVLVVLASVTIAGYSGVQSPGTPTAEPTDETDVSPEEIPGVSNGTLTDAAALATANGAAVVGDGATIRITQTAPDRETRMLLTVADDGAFEFSRTVSADGNESTVDYYRNDTATYVRAETGGETTYRVVEQPFRPLEGVNSSLETVLAAGDFTVATEPSDSATVVLTADEFTTSPNSPVLDGATPERARLVLTQEGGIQNLTVTGQRDGQTVTYTYERRQAPVDRVPAPGWLADVPPTADLHPDLSTDVVDDSYLRIDHDGGDTVPRNTTLAFSANDTAGTVTFDSPLEAGDTRYAYFAPADESLVVTEDRPAADATVPIESPASVTISTADGVTLLSVGMSWGSESVSEGSTGDAGGSDA